MAGSALGSAFYLLLSASIMQGLRHFVVEHNKTTEAAVGQNVSLLCVLESVADLKIVNIEWNKRGNETRKLVLYTTNFGYHNFEPNVTIQTVSDDANRLTGSRLLLPEVQRQDGGSYVCDIATFPFGSIRTEMELKIKDPEITCDVDGNILVQSGENVTIRCATGFKAEYRWTKNRELVSQNESLELPWVTEAHAGLYALTVNAGDINLHKEFIITVLPTTTRSRTATAPPQSDVTEEDRNPSAGGSVTTPATTGLFATDGNAALTEFAKATDAYTSPGDAALTDAYGSHGATVVSDGAATLGSTRGTSGEVTGNGSSPRTHTQHPGGSVSITPGESSTWENSAGQESAAAPTLSSGDPAAGSEDEGNVQSQPLLVFLIVPILVLIAVAGFLCRRQIIKQRMDLPPPFKPPPPPVKYTSARPRGVHPQAFPISRCNSTELEDVRHLIFSA